MKAISRSEPSGYGFYIGIEDVESAYSADITLDDERTVTGRRKDPAWHEFNHYRKVRPDELHPQLSNRILYDSGLDPYSEKQEIKTEFLSEEGCKAIRVADSTEAHYYVLEESESELFSDLDRISEKEVF
ncbi:MAG: hypothetical protein ACI9LV_000764 [Candidatus Nanohaloarchaea archaeon]